MEHRQSVCQPLLHHITIDIENKFNQQIRLIKYFQTSNNDTKTSNLIKSLPIAVRLKGNNPTGYRDSQCIQYSYIYPIGSCNVNREFIYRLKQGVRRQLVSLNKTI